MTKNYVLKPIYSDENECINDTLSMDMLLERIEKMAEVHNLLLDRLNIQNGYEGLAPVSLQEASQCANCSRLDHIEIDCPVMAVKGVRHV